MHIRGLSKTGLLWVCIQGLQFPQSVKRYVGDSCTQHNPMVEEWPGDSDWAGMDNSRLDVDVNGKGQVGSVGEALEFVPGGFMFHFACRACVGSFLEVCGGSCMSVPHEFILSQKKMRLA